MARPAQSHTLKQLPRKEDQILRDNRAEKRTSHTRGESTLQLIDRGACALRALDVIDVKCIAAHRLYQERNAPSMNGVGGGVNARLQHVIPPAPWQTLHI